MLTLSQICAEAQKLGFIACGAAQASAVGRWRVLQWKQWLQQGRHASMAYLEAHADLRSDPRLLFEGTRTVVSVALNYYPAQTFSPSTYRLARYAHGKDYHDVMRNKLRMLLAALSLREGVDARICCDTAPIDERYWAWRCGIGLLGRNTQLIIPRHGSFHFLGELLLTQEVEGATPSPLSVEEEAAPDVHRACGNCRRCIEACPSGALCEEAGMDARRCLSYLTIEHRGPLPEWAGPLMGNCFYGCDRCAEVCPHNRWATPTEESSLHASSELLSMQSVDWHTLDVDRYRALFKGSAVKRAKLEGLLRNIAAIKNAENRHNASFSASEQQ